MAPDEGSGLSLMVMGFSQWLRLNDDGERIKTKESNERA